ncbi:MAG: prepilin-type N-terminal cleavage/methylation domain-containing protein [Candidatus Omnitrophica bacterium]|nr:prepilin-type N-terminal cleavage/methylation domain-containing protein [Candidatus Omnitrophota bacterium]
MIGFKGRGFTLVEIMIVVALIALVAAIAVPTLLKHCHDSNETAAVASLSKIRTAMESYRASRPRSVYTGATLVRLASSDNGPAYIDKTLGTGEKNGYGFRLMVTRPRSYVCTAQPLSKNVSGSRDFRVQQDGVIQTRPDVSKPWSNLE